MNGFFVAPTGIEPVSSESESEILSIKLRSLEKFDFLIFDLMNFETKIIHKQIKDSTILYTKIYNITTKYFYRNC